jgi:O-antigen/teichoic acid export membrane protein
MLKSIAAHVAFYATSERFRRLSKEGSWVVLGQALAVVGSLVGVRVLTEFLNPASFGELALGLTLAALVNQTVLGPLGAGVLRFYAPAVERGDLDGYLKSVLRLVLSATGIIVLAILLTVSGLLFTGPAEWISIAIAAFVFAILSGYNAILSCIQNAARQRAIVALHQGIESWVRFATAVGLMVLLGATSAVAMVGYSMAVILVLGSQSAFFRKVFPRQRAISDKGIDWSRQIWKFTWPISIFGIFTWVQLASDRWALELFTTRQDVGLYAVLFQLGYYPMLVAYGVSIQVLAPIFYQRAGDASERRRNEDVSNLSWRLTAITLGMTGLAFFAALLFHTQVFRIFVATEYASVSYLLPWMILSGGIFAAGETRGLNLLTEMKTQSMMVVKIITAIWGVILNLAGAYWYGTKGVVIAGILFSVAYFLWMTVLSRYSGEAGLE